LVCMTDNKVVCISKAHQDDICKKRDGQISPAKGNAETSELHSSD
jgi:hypothetical protein